MAAVLAPAALPGFRLQDIREPENPCRSLCECHEWRGCGDDSIRRRPALRVRVADAARYRPIGSQVEASARRFDSVPCPSLYRFLRHRSRSAKRSRTDQGVTRNPAAWMPPDCGGHYIEPDFRGLWNEHP